jgi:predicted transcriptional regulator
MAKKFRDLVAQTMTKAQQADAAEIARQMRAELPLHELRQARDYTQTTLAETLEVAQPEISRIEKRTDMYISTLRRYIEAMGGHLDIVARFPDGEVRITQFETAGAA